MKPWQMEHKKPLVGPRRNVVYNPFMTFQIDTQTIWRLKTPRFGFLCHNSWV